MSRGPLSLFHAASMDQREKEKEEATKRREHHVAMIKQGQVNIFEVKEGAKDAMLEQVIARLRAEMAAKQANAYVQATGEQMINFLTNHPEVAEQMVDETKTLEESYCAVEQFAKGLNNRTAMVTPQQTFEAIMQYYGVIGAVLLVANVTLPETPTASPITEEPAQEQPKKRFKASMDDFW